MEKKTNKAEKKAIIMLIGIVMGCIAIGVLLGGHLTATYMEAKQKTIWMPRVCYVVVTEPELAKIEKSTQVPQERTGQQLETDKIEKSLAETAEKQTGQNEPETSTKALTRTIGQQPAHLGEFKLTAYCTCSKCCGDWSDGITYTGVKATPGRTIAVDPEVIPLGSTVYINGFEYIAEDVGGAIDGYRIDVLCSSHEEALEFGIQYADVSILER